MAFPTCSLVSLLSFLPKDIALLEDICNFAKSILDSRLAPWQRVDCLKTFFFPSLQFSLRVNKFNKCDWKKIDAVIKSLVKKTFNLPSNAANEYLYGLREGGMCGIPLISEDSDIACVDSAFKLLTSRDLIVKDLAWDELTKIANY